MESALAALQAAEVEEAADFLASLVAIPSVTVPTGVAPSAEAQGEAGVAAALREFLDRRGIPHQSVEVEPGRPQLTARIGTGEPEILFTAHMDTVPPVSWDRDPYLPLRDGHRLFGLGACDNKASITAQVLAMARIHAAGGPPRGTLAFVATMGEETFGIGSRHLVQSGYRPAGVIVGEPTELRLVRVECGNIRWRIHTVGRAAHGSRPWEGESAIFRMAEVIRVLRDQVLPGIISRRHPLVGRAAMNIGLIQGGASVNIVPDRCTLWLERRLLPGEDPHEGMEAVNSQLREILGSQWLQFEAPTSWNRPLETAEEADVTCALRQALLAEGLSGVSTGVSYGSDANRFAEANVPCLVFGPGDIAQAHTNQEWVDLRQVAMAARVLEGVVRHWPAGNA